MFHDPAGLDGTEGFDGGNFVSARDLAIAGPRPSFGARAGANCHRAEYHFVDPKGEAHWIPSMDETFLESYPGAVGIKTGYTDAAGYCLMAAATRDGRTMLAVVMNGYNPTATAIDLLNQGFATPVRSERDRLTACRHLLCQARRRLSHRLQGRTRVTAAATCAHGREIRYSGNVANSATARRLPSGRPRAVVR